MSKRTELLICVCVFLATIFFALKRADAWVSPSDGIPEEVPRSGSSTPWAGTNSTVGGSTGNSADTITTMSLELWVDVDGDGKADADDTGSTWAQQWSVDISNITATGVVQLQTLENIVDGTIRLSTQGVYTFRYGNSTVGYTEKQMTGLSGFYLVRVSLIATNQFRNIMPYATSGASAYMDGNGYIVDSNGVTTSRRAAHDAFVTNFRVNRKPS